MARPPTSEKIEGEWMEYNKQLVSTQALPASLSHSSFFFGRRRSRLGRAAARLFKVVLKRVAETLEDVAMNSQVVELFCTREERKRPLEVRKEEHRLSRFIR